MYGHALKLQRIQGRIVQVCPWASRRGARRSLPDTAIVSSVDVAEAVKEQGMLVYMQTTAVGGKGVTTVGRFSNQTTAGTRSLPANINNISIGGIDGDGHVIKTLVATKPTTSG